jgi:hypothetical protein
MVQIIKNLIKYHKNKSTTQQKGPQALPPKNVFSPASKNPVLNAPTGKKLYNSLLSIIHKNNNGTNKKITNN